MNLTNEARQSIGMGERSDRNVPQMRGWWANSCFQIGWWYEAGQTDDLTTHSNILPVSLEIVWVLRALMKYRLNFPGHSRCLCTIQSAICIRGTFCAIRHESGSTSSPKTVLPAHQPPPPYSQVNTRCEVWWNEPIGLFTDIDQFEEFTCATKHYVGFYVGLVDKDKKKLPFRILERVSHCSG